MSALPFNDAIIHITASAGQTVLTGDFPIVDDDDVVIVRTRAETDTVLDLSSDYTIAGAGTQTGFTATLVSAAQADDIFTLYRSTTIENLDYRYLTDGSFSGPSLTAAIDMLTRVAQELARDQKRSLQFPITEAATPALPSLTARLKGGAGSIFVWDGETGQPRVAVASARDLESYLMNTAYLEAIAASFGGDRAPDVRDFGAKGDGETDDTAAFKAAAASGKNIYVSPSNAPDKPYLLSDEIEMTQGTKFYGGGHLSYVKQTVVDKNCFIANDDTEVLAMRLEGYGGEDGTDFTKGNGVFASGRRNVRICWNELIGFEACGAQLRGCIDVEVSANYCRDSYWGAFSSSADILAYSDPGHGKRINIHHNFCLSRNSEGVAVNILGGDTDVIVDANICVTLAQDGSEYEMSSDGTSLQRRHGIQIGYNGVPDDGEDQRIQVTNNISRNNGWTGIYCNVGGGAAGNVRTGPFLIAGNYLSKCAQVASGVLSGGIVIYGGGVSDTLANNTIWDCTYAGGIVFRAEATPDAQMEIRGNTVGRCKRGIYTDVQGSHVTIADNKIIATLAGNNDIYCGLNSGYSSGGGIWLKGNRIQRSDAYTSIVIDTQASTERCFVEDNWLVGVDTATGTTTTNAAISIARSEMVTCLRNKIRNFKGGINFGQAIATARIITPVCDGNDFDTVDTAIIIFGNSSEKVVLLEGNAFRSVTTKVGMGGGFKAGYLGRRYGDQIEIIQSAAPTVGTWVVGDRVLHTAPAAGGNIGSVCTAAGAPGTWKTYGAIAA